MNHLLHSRQRRGQNLIHDAVDAAHEPQHPRPGEQETRAQCIRLAHAETDDAPESGLKPIMAFI